MSRYVQGDNAGSESERWEIFNAVIGQTARVVREVYGEAPLNRGWGLQAAAVAMQALDAFRLDARLVKVGVAAFSPERWRTLLRENRLEEPGLVFTSALPGKFRGFQWNGHVVVTVDGSLGDASASQFARPSAGLNVPPAVIIKRDPVPRVRWATIAHARSAVLVHVELPGHQDFRWSDPFLMPFRMRKLSDRVVRAVGEYGVSDVSPVVLQSTEAVPAELIFGDDTVARWEHSRAFRVDPPINRLWRAVGGRGLEPPAIR